jgi:hypothetical protein
MSHLDSLAGLDSMVLHINSHSNPSPTPSNTTATLGGDSICSRSPQKEEARTGEAHAAGRQNTIFQYRMFPALLESPLGSFRWLME